MANHRSPLSAIKLIVAVLVVASFVFIPGSPASAQGGPIAYNAGVIGDITADSPFAVYTFNGNAGDLVTVLVAGLAPDMAPSVSLLNASQQMLATSNRDPYGGVGEARLSYRLPAAGGYSLLVSNSNGTPGQFLLRVGNTAPVASAGLVPGLPVTVNIPFGSPVQVYSFSANPAAPSTLSIQSSTPGFGFYAVVRNSAGKVVASFDGGSNQSATLTVLGGVDTYEVSVSSSNPESQGTVVITLLDGAAAPQQQQSAPPADTGSSSQPAAAAPANICTISAAGNVNVRTGPSTNYAVLGTMYPGTYLPVSGTSGDGWYAADYNGQQGWVFGGVAMLNGPCNGLTQVATPPPPPTQAAPPPPQATEEVTENGGGSPPPTAAPTTPPPPAAQTAPEDGQYVINAERDGVTFFSEYISYPEGDRADQVHYNIDLVNGANTGTRNVLFSLQCTGTGSEYVRWGTGAFSLNMRCGDTLEKFFTYDSDQVMFTIHFPDGSGPGYVQYTLTAAVTG